MAVTDRENTVGFTDKRRIQGATATVLSTPGNYVDVYALRSRLTTANPSYYTTARLNEMTKNDMVYAVRQIDDAAGIK